MITSYLVAFLVSLFITVISFAICNTVGLMSDIDGSKYLRYVCLPNIILFLALFSYFGSSVGGNQREEAKFLVDWKANSCPVIDSECGKYHVACTIRVKNQDEYFISPRISVKPRTTC